MWLQWTIGGIGFASAVVLTGGFLIPAVAFFGGVAGGIGGHWVGGKLFGGGSNGQKLTAFGGAFLGGMLGAKGGSWFDKRYTIKTEGFGSNLANLRIVPKHAEIAKKLDYIKINERSHGQAVYYNSKAPSELRYITRDIDQHNGGFWKAASSVKNLGNKTTRSGTYNEHLIKVGK